MKKALLVVALALTIFLAAQKTGSSPATINYRLENKNLKLLVADNSEEWRKGLMDVKKKENFDGMIFIFPYKQSLTFWNKDTLVDLDVYWLNDEKVIGKSFLPSITKSITTVTVTSSKPANKVIELIK